MLKELYHNWNSLMPNVTPFYAIKCNPNIQVVKTLVDLGCSFDCASPNEISLVLNLGGCNSKIIYANPCKKTTDIKFALCHSINLIVADSICELEKIYTHYGTSANIVIRIYACDPDAHCLLSSKYGAHEDEWKSLILKCNTLNLNITGVSFHVGSGAKNAYIYNNSIMSAIKFKNLAKELCNFNVSLLDIGGGFTVKLLPEIAKVVNATLNENPVFDSVIAEPGRYFVENIARLYTRVIGIKNNNYYLTDGMYGSFNCSIYDHKKLIPKTLHATKQKTKCILWGPTCDSFDKIGAFTLSEMKYGDWILWENVGAYTVSGSCDFNGINFTNPITIYETD